MLGCLHRGLLFSLFFLFEIPGLTLAIVFGQVAILAETFRIVKLRVVFASPCFLGAATAMIAIHAHIFGVMAARDMRTALASLACSYRWG